MNCRSGFSPIVALLMLSLNPGLQAGWADDAWPQFRGPDGQGHAVGKNVPRTWSDTENVTWSVEIPGRGWSSPVAADGQVWLTTALEAPAGEALAAEKRGKGFMAPQLDVAGKVTLKAICVEQATGKIVHEVVLFEVDEPDAIHKLNSFASPTPVLDGGRLYCHFGTLGTACVETTAGKVLWRNRLPLQHAVGPGSSPAIYDDLLIIPCDGVDQQYVCALDKHTGEQVWKTDRPPIRKQDGDQRKAYSTPLVVRAAAGDQVIIPGAQWVCSYEPKSGRELWRVDHGSGFSNVPRPVAAHGMTYICTGFMRPELWAIRLGGQGDVSESHVVWKHDQQVPTMASPIVVGDEIYMISDQGVATCFDAVTGEQLWKERVSGNYSASPLYVDGHIYFFNREGKATVVKPGRVYQEVAACQLPGGYMATPAVVDGALIVRTDKRLYRIESP